MVTRLVRRVVTGSSYSDVLHCGLFIFVEFGKLPYPLVTPISARFHRSSHLLLSIGSFSNSSPTTSELTSTLFLIISYFIVQHCMFTTKFSSKLKSQLQVIFGQDSFPLNMSSFQANRLLQNFTKGLLANGWWDACFYHNSFYKKTFLSFCKRLVCCKIFLFCQTDSFVFLFLMPADGCF